MEEKGFAGVVVEEEGECNEIKGISGINWSLLFCFSSVFSWFVTLKLGIFPEIITDGSIKSNEIRSGRDNLFGLWDISLSSFFWIFFSVTGDGFPAAEHVFY